MGKTSIEWTDFSINPIRARDPETGRGGHFCEKVSAGCTNCYSSAMQRRFGMHEFLARNREKIEFWFDEDKLLQVLRRKRPTKWFWCDMTDMFGDWVSDEWLDLCFSIMALTPHHTHQLLTKRPQRMYEYLSHRGRAAEIAIKVFKRFPVLREAEREAKNALELWPLPQVWLGVSCEDQKTADERIPWLLKTPAAVRFVSYEPALGPVDFKKFISQPLFYCPGCAQEKRKDHCTKCGTYSNTASNKLIGIDLVICGGESGPHARPFDIQWARDVIRQCRESGTKVFVKQLGSRPYDEAIGVFGDGGDEIKLKDRKGGSVEEWPEDLRVRELPEVGR